MTLKYAKFAIATLTAAFLTACGGGGGSNDAAGAPGAALVTITSSNYHGVATDSVARANGASNVSSLGTVLVGAQITPSESYGLKNIALSAATTVLDNWSVFNDPTLVGAVTQKTIACPSGGNVSASANDADNNRRPSAGDSVNATFNNCSSQGIQLHGSISIVINRYSGNFSSTGSGSLTMTFNNVTAGNDALDGKITMDVTVSGGVPTSVTIAMPSLSIVSNGDSFTYSGFSMAVSESGSSARLTMSGRIASSKYGGAVVISTPTTMVIDASRNVTGTILLTGKDGTKVRIVGSGNSILLIEADTTGNGTYDTSTTVALSGIGL